MGHSHHKHHLWSKNHSADGKHRKLGNSGWNSMPVCSSRPCLGRVAARLSASTAGSPHVHLRKKKYRRSRQPRRAWASVLEGAGAEGQHRTTPTRAEAPPKVAIPPAPCCTPDTAFCCQNGAPGLYWCHCARSWCTHNPQHEAGYSASSGCHVGWAGAMQHQPTIDALWPLSWSRRCTYVNVTCLTPYEQDVK